MDIVQMLNDKSIKAIEKRAKLVDLLMEKKVTIQELDALSGTLNDKQLVSVLEAIEAITQQTPELANKDYLLFAGRYILADNNSLKREAARIVGNLAHRFPDDLDQPIKDLLENTKHDGTVVRWSSAYALGRIVALPQYANSPLFDTVTDIWEKESENGVKNQYAKGLKTANKMRK